MDGIEFANSLPPVHSDNPNPAAREMEVAKQLNDRESMILLALSDGNIAPAIEPVTVRTKDGSVEGVVYVTGDALMVGDANPVRVNVTATLLQRMADHLGALLLTPRMVDAIHEQATVKVSPCLSTDYANMMTTAAMVAHSRAVDAKVAGRKGLTSTVCKDWVIANHLLDHPLGAERAALNYGWPDPGAPNGVRWQNLGDKHNRAHVDYSQCARVMLRECLVAGARRDLADVLRDPKLCSLASGEGVLRVLRLPGVPESGRAVPSTVPPAADPEPAEGLVDAFVQAKGFTPAGRRRVLRVVLHTAEVPERPRSARAVAEYFRAGPFPRGPVSAHYCTDAAEIIQCVHEQDVAWAAPRANADGVQVEMSGYAKQVESEWHDAFSDATLQRTARLVADVCRRWGIPTEFVDVAGLKAGAGGITTHAACALAFGGSDHTDPGKGFPMDYFVDLVRAASSNA